MNENQEREYVLEREIEELKALLAARDTAIAELRTALECCERNDRSEPYAYAGEESKRPSDGAQCEHRWQRWQTPREIARAALKQAVETKDRAHAAAIDREFAAIKRLELAEAVIDALGGVLCIPVYKGRECFFGGYSGFELGHASAESIDKLNAAYAAWQANKEQA